MKQLSILNPSKTLHDVIEDQILYIIENYVRKPPYIINVSKKQLWWGQGKLFKDCPVDYIRKGFLANTGFRIPSKVAVKKAERLYGYPALTDPFGILNNITNSVIRWSIMKQELTGNFLDDIRVVLGKGYVMENGKLNPQQTQGISVYFIMRADGECREEQQEWLVGEHSVEKKNMWVRYQYLRNQLTHAEHLIIKKRAATNLAKLNTKLLIFKEYEELNPMVDLVDVPWAEEDF